MNRRSILQGLLTGLAGLLFWPNSDGVALTSMAHPRSSNEVPVDVELNEESLVRGYFVVEEDTPMCLLANEFEPEPIKGLTGGWFARLVKVGELVHDQEGWTWKDSQATLDVASISHVGADHGQSG